MVQENQKADLGAILKFEVNQFAVKKIFCLLDVLQCSKQNIYARQSVIFFYNDLPALP